ncbi:hypothetical protein HAPAU_41980 [Halalkalicoccus paucihalophilus]|uniref:Uncharacterized protein n=1 Tax=Halalkalicoccus paucihalophilus TaxID=1008153 RepID=A0A151A7P0_9EURY|nr:hypothetical protein HAPAU_41980 [Halalkalicoccus paucihalophilus]
MHTQEPLTVTLEPDPLDCWVEESTASALRALVVRLHGSGLSLRETAAALETFGVHRSHQAVFQWVHRVAQEAPNPPRASPSRVAIDKTAVTIDTKRHWLYAAIDIEPRLVLDVWLSPRRRTDPTAEFPREPHRRDRSDVRRVAGTAGLSGTRRCSLRCAPVLAAFLAVLSRRLRPSSRPADAGATASTRGPPAEGMSHQRNRLLESRHEADD